MKGVDQVGANPAVRQGFPLLPILVAIFAAAKVFGASAMSWWWVFSPILIPLGFALALFTIAAILLGIAGVIEIVQDARRK